MRVRKRERDRRRAKRVVWGRGGEMEKESDMAPSLVNLSYSLACSFLFFQVVQLQATCQFRGSLPIMELTFTLKWITKVFTYFHDIFRFSKNDNSQKFYRCKVHLKIPLIIFWFFMGAVCKHIGCKICLVSICLSLFTSYWKLQTCTSLHRSRSIPLSSRKPISECSTPFFLP